MLRLSLLAVALVAPAVAAPVPKDFKKNLPSYYPLHPGDVWVYKFGDKEIRVVTKGVTEKDGVTTGTLATEVDGREVATESMRVDKLGVHRTHTSGQAVEPPYTLISFDPKRENKWPVRAKVGQVEIVGSCEVAGKEEVTVPAGKYTAVKVVADTKIGGTPAVVTYWLAERVGQVKMTLKLAGQDATLELQSYTPGKKVGK